MLSLGHPLVCDSKYGEDQFAADRMWCPRNFLHTYRVGFEDTPEGDDLTGKSLVELCCPLPKDLRESLGKLQPVDDASAKYTKEWLAGDRDQLRNFEAYTAEASVDDVGEPQTDQPTPA